MISISWQRSGSRPRATACRGIYSARAGALGLEFRRQGPRAAARTRRRPTGRSRPLRAAAMDRGRLSQSGLSRLVADYAGRLAERFHGRVSWYTPLNEPRITAWYCGRLGWWPPYRRGWQGFVAVMLAIAAGSSRRCVRLAASIRKSLPVMSMPPISTRPRSATLQRGRAAQEIVFLALDLVSGGSIRPHILGMAARQRRAHGDSNGSRRTRRLPVVGMNLYPMFTQKRLLREHRGRFRIRMPYAIGRTGRTARASSIYESYGVPADDLETASLGSVARRRDWLEQSVAAVRRCAPRACRSWAIPGGRCSPSSPGPIGRAAEPSQYLAQMGLWDLDPRTLNRHSTPLVDVLSGFRRGRLGRRWAAAAPAGSMTWQRGE